MNGKCILETPRLILREMTPDDLGALCRILCDADVMRTAYEHPFTVPEAQAWLERHLQRYATLGYGLWAVVQKQSGEMIGQCGITLQQWRDETVPEIGYLFQKAHWHKGYAAEAAIACREYAFSALHAPRVCSIIRDSNRPAQQVALRCGMRRIDQDHRTFRHTEMDFLLFAADRPKE